MKNQLPNIYYICNDAERALGLEDTLQNYHIICIDDNPIIDYMRQAGVNIFCLERETGELNAMFRNSNRLLQHKLVQEYIAKTNKGKETPPYIWVFKIASNIEVTAEKLGYRLVNTSSALNKKFELKLSQYEKLKDAGVNFPKTVISRMGNAEFDMVVQELGADKFVIQYDRGHTGTSTVFVHDEREFLRQKEKFPKRKARLSRFINGDAWTINACVTGKGVTYGGLSYQITGIPKCTSLAGGTVGNDWSVASTLSSRSLEQIMTITKRSGEVMRDSGFRGLFGLDFVIDSYGEVFLIEINARQPASTSMHTKLMQRHELTPLKAMHLSEFIKEYSEVFDGYDLNQNMAAIKPIQAAQILMRNLLPKPLKANTHIPSGVYTVDSDGDFKFAHEGWSVADITDPDNQVFMLAVADGHLVNKGNEIVRIQALQNMVKYDGGIEQKYDNLVNNLYSRIYGDQFVTP